MQDENVDALIRCFIGEQSDGDFEKLAIVGSLFKFVGAKALKGKAVKSGLALRGGKKLLGWSVKNPGKAATLGLLGVFEGGSAYSKGRSASIKPAGYNPSASYYLPNSRMV